MVTGTATATIKLSAWHSAITYVNATKAELSTADIY